VPRSMHVVDALPMNATGKVDKVLLAKWACDAAAEH